MYRIRPILLTLLLTMAGCAQVIPVSPQYSATDVSVYFWNGSPYNPTFLVSSHANPTALTDQVTLHVNGDTLILKDGIAPHGTARFTVTPSTATLDAIEPNNVLVLPSNTRLSDNVGISYAAQTLHILSLLYTHNGSRLIAGTNGAGFWYSDNDGKNWVRASGGITSVGTALLELPYSPSIYALAGDSIFYSTDTGKTYTGIANPCGHHSAMTSLEDTLIVAGISTNTSRDIIKIDPLLHQVSEFVPRFPLGVTDTILSLTGTGAKTLIAGAYQSSTTANHIYRCNAYEPAWAPLQFVSGSSLNIYVLLATPNAVFGGTGNTGIISSTDEGLTWKTRKSMVSRSANITTMTWAAYQKTGFAGTSTGEVLSFGEADSDIVQVLAQTGELVTSVAFSPRGFLIVATVDSLYTVSTTGAIQPLAYSATLPIVHSGMLVMLNAGANGLAKGDSWQTGFLLDSGETVPLPLTARVMDHLDSLVLPLPTERAPQKDVFVVRYANESAPGTVNAQSLYWMIYYARDMGPVLLELVQNSLVTGQPVILNEAVFDPPY